MTPSAFPRSEFYKAVEMQPILNELTHRVAHDEEFLKEALSTTLSVDSFTARLYNIWEIVKKEGVKQVRDIIAFVSRHNYTTVVLSNVLNVSIV